MPSGKRRADSAAPAPLNRPLALAEPGPYLRAAILWNVEFANLVVINLGRSFNHLRETLQDFGIGVAAIVVRVLFPIPQTDRDRFGAVGGEERDLVLEAVLLAQNGQDVRFQRPPELRGRIGLEVQRDIACVHIDSLATNMNLRTTDDSLATVTLLRCNYLCQVYDPRRQCTCH